MEKIWYKSYDPGVPHTINPDQFSSLLQVLEDSFQCYPARPCFVSMGFSLTYRQLDEYSLAFAGYLQSELKMNKGERILLMMPSILQYPVAVFGAMRAGLIVVNANPLSTYKELNILLKKTEASCVVVFENFAYLLEPAILNTKVKHVIYTKLGDMFPFFKRNIVNFVVKSVKKMVPKWRIANAIEFRDTIKRKYGEKYKKVLVDLSDVAFVQLSGGRSTGWENCVMLTHRNIIANMLQCGFWLESFFRYESNGAILNPFPFSRTVCMTVSFVMLKVGYKTILIVNPRDINSIAHEVKKTTISAIMSINGLYNAMLNNEAFRQLDFSRLKFSFSGGAATQKSVAIKWQKLTGCSLSQAYGLVETSPAIALTPFSSHQFNECDGLPLPSTEIKIVDISGNELGLNQIGELWVKGPQVFKGYWGDPEKTKQAFSEDGWFKTGDMVKMNDSGYLIVIDRKEDVITINGRDIYPKEIESVLSEIPGVFEAATISYHLETGETVIKAVVVRSDPLVDEQIIIQYCKEKLSEIQVPKVIEFRIALPKSIAGYVLRRVLREEESFVKVKST